ncbi:NCS2 family permease [Clostridium sp.]|uniref:NCS2 family permease n=1 Tax=Clostridium sp. TaxID=1506 RepID=UPI002617DD07|nr:NCS2 family permease [Clostridium sp.]
MKNFFKLKEHETNIRTELLAGLTSFFAAVYIIVVNASILSDGGVSVQPLIIATVLASLIGCVLVAFMSNSPLIIMPGMGINALFTYTIVNTMGLSFQQALGAVIAAGILFIVVAVTPLAEMLTSSIPTSLKQAITVGIGIFITFLGLQKAGLIVGDSSTLVKLGNIASKEVLVFFITMIIMLVLFIKDIPGSFLIGILSGTVISILFGVVDLSSFHLSLPNFSEYKEVFFSADFSGLTSISFWIATFSLALVLIFENIGLLHGQVDGMLKQPHKRQKALNAVALTTIVCGICGTSPSVSTVEGTAGIAAGGKTGLTSIFTGFLFLISIFFIPVISLIPNAAISPVLIIIGGLMIQHIVDIDFKDFTESFPAFITLTIIPLTFSIVDGIAFGFIAYPICKLASKKYKDVSIPMYVISAIFLLYFILHATQM